MKKPFEILVGVAGILLIAAAVYCGWFWLRETKPRSAEELAQIALNASSAAGSAVGSVQQQSAAAPVQQQSPEAGSVQQQSVATGSVQQQSAAVELVQLGAPALPQMRKVLSESQSTEVRAQMILGLAQQWDLDSMPAFLAAMDDPSPLIRGRAEAAVTKILTTVGDYRADDPPEKRRLALQSVRKKWDAMRASPRYPVYQERAKAMRR